MRVVKILPSIFCCLLFLFNINAVEKGSDFLLSIEPFFSFPASDSDNGLLTFGFFKNGFGLQDSTTTCTFKSVFPVSGSLNLNGGQLYLANDLIFQDLTTFNSGGMILGNKHSMELSTGITGISSTYNTVFQDIKIFLNSDFLISGTVKFKGNCLLDGRWNRVTLGNNANIVIDRNSSLCLRNIEIDQIKRSNIRCLDNGGSLILDNMYWDQDANFTFSNGSIKFVNNVIFSGPWQFGYTSIMTSTIDADSNWMIADLTQLGIGRQGSIFGREPIYFTDVTSILMMKNSRLNVNSNGMRITRGTFLIDGEVTFDVHSTGSSNGLAFGNGDQSQDMLLKFFPASVANLARGDLVHDVVALGNFISDDVQKIFMRQGVGANYWSNFDSYFVNVDLRFALGGLNYLAPGKHGYFNNCRVKIDSLGLEFSVTATRVNDFVFGLNNGGNIAVTSGAFIAPLGVSVYGPSNVFTAAADVSGNITLKSPASGLLLGINGNLSSNITMNGGTVTLGADLRLDKSVILSGTGNLVLGSRNMLLGVQDTTWTSSIVFSGTGSQITLRSLLSLGSTVTFNGTCTINGNGNELHLSSLGNIVVGANSTLSFKDISLTGIKGNNLRCVDNSAKIILRNVEWAQDGNYSFAAGGLRIRGLCNMRADGYAFAYQSAMTSTIDSLGALYFAQNMTFSYDPIDRQPNHILFTNNTSKIGFDGATLYVGKSGLRLYKGGLEVMRNTNFYAAYNTLFDGSYSSTTGIILGNNDDVNDCVCSIYQGATLSVNNGYLIYRNVLSDSLRMGNAFSLVRMNPRSKLKLEQTLSLGDGQIQLSTAAVPDWVGGITINGSMSTF